MIPTNLIENALSLTGKTMEDMQEFVIPKGKCIDFGVYKFSYTKFFAYLLSAEFIEKYRKIRFESLSPDIIELVVGLNKNGTIVSDFGEAIYEYQKSNHEPLISLLEKIGKN